MVRRSWDPEIVGQKDTLYAWSVHISRDYTLTDTPERIPIAGVALCQPSDAVRHRRRRCRYRCLIVKFPSKLQALT